MTFVATQRTRSEAELLERFWSKVDIGRPGECWLWTGTRATNGGYGRFFVAGRGVVAHRFAYEAQVGEIPEGLTLDHTCGNPACVNPAHLEPVTFEENMRRTRSTAPTCPNGHARAEHDGVDAAGRRFCRACAREAKRLYKARRRARAAA